MLTQGQRWLLGLAVGCWLFRRLCRAKRSGACGITVADGCWLLAVGAEAEPERLTQGQPPFFNSTRKKEVLTRCKPG